MLKIIEDNRSALVELCRRYGVARLDIFGSAVRDDFRSDSSDLDFLVRFENYSFENAADRYFGLLLDLEVLFGREIDLVSDTAIRNPFFRQEVDQSRVSLYAA